MISISISSIVRTALALSALRKQPRLLQTTDEPALRRMAGAKVAECLLHLAPLVVETNIDDVDPETDDVITAELAIRAGAQPIAAKAIEKAAVAALMLDLVGKGTSEYLRELRANLQVVALLRTKPGRLARG